MGSVTMQACHPLLLRTCQALAHVCNAGIGDGWRTQVTISEELAVACRLAFLLRHAIAVHLVSKPLDEIWGSRCSGARILMCRMED